MQQLIKGCGKMKKIFNILFIFIMLNMLLSGCIDSSVNNDAVHTYSNKKMEYKKLDIDIENGGLIDIIGNYLVYFKNEYRADNPAKRTYYTYNINSGEMSNVGEIKEWSIDTNKYAAFPNGKIILNTGIIKNDILENHIYRIDISNKKMEEIIINDKETSLIKCTAVNDMQYIELQTYFMKNGNSYDTIKIGNNNDDQRKVIIVREKKYNLGINEFIICASVYNEIIYTYEGRETDGQILKILCKYDLEGNKISETIVPELEQFLKNEQPGGKVGDLFKMHIIGDFIAFETMSRAYLLLKKSDDDIYSRVDSFNDNQLRLIENSTYKSGKQERSVFFNNNKKLFYEFTNKTGELIQLDIPVQGEVWVAVYNGDKLIFKDELGVHYYSFYT